jgi:hypothetical protein
MIDYTVKEISYDDTKPFILEKHYAKRMPSISFAYGLFEQNKLIGVCTIGKPASPFLCKGICGEEEQKRVFELNRLVLNEDTQKNTASFFVGSVLRALKENDLILVSYADEGMGHYGYVYQATNWIYTGKTKARTDKYMPGKKHSRHYTEEFAHLRKVRTSKHRYVFFTGSSKRYLLKKLRYNIYPYPKGDSERYILGEGIKEKIINTKNNTVFYE